MVSVDDIIVSLRIDDTSNLGKLYKQLTALVGKEGTKPIGIDIDANIKRDLTSIKTQLSFISAQTVPDIRDIKGLSESLHRDRKVLQRTFDAAADRLISEKTDAYQKQLEEYGAKNREELLIKMKETLSNFLGMMELGAMEKLPAKVMQNIAVVSKELIAKEKLADGDRKTLITKMEKAIGELNTMFSKVLKKAGITHLPEFNLYQIRKSWYRKQDLDEQAIKFNIDTLLGTDEKVIDSYNKIKEFMFKGGITNFLISSLTKLGITPTPEMFTKEAVKKSPELQAIAVGVLQKAWGTKAGIPTGFHSYLRDLLAKTQTLNIKDMYEKGRPDFILLNNKLEDLLKIFPPDVAKTLAQLISYIELKSILTESNKEQFKKYKDMIGEDFIVGVASLVKSSFIDYFPEIKTAMVNIVSKLKELAPEKFTTEERMEQMSEERIKEKIEEEDYLGKLEDVIKGEPGTKQPEYVETAEEKQDREMMELMKEIQKTTDDTNKEVKKENDEAKVEKMDE